MLSLSELKIAEKVAEFTHPLGFKILLAYLPTSIEREISKGCLVKRYEKGKAVEDVDTDKFYALMAPKIIKGWSGLTFGMLKKLVPISTDSKVNDDDEVNFSSENAIFLLRNSDNFDNWVHDHRSDLEYFNTLEQAEKN